MNQFISFVFWMYVGVVFTTTSKIFDGFVHIQLLDDKQCHASDVLFSTPDRSLLGCGYECGRTESCFGFTYNEGSKECVGCGGQFANWTTFGPAIGATFYLDEWFSFGESDYKLSRTDYSFYDAVAYCNTARAQIAALEDEAENQFIVQTLNAFYVYENVWIGLTDEDQDGVWTWISTGQEANFTYWYTEDQHLAQPDGGIYENCTNLARAHNFRWADKVCSDDQMVLCERKSAPKRR